MKVSRDLLPNKKKKKKKENWFQIFDFCVVAPCSFVGGYQFSSETSVSLSKLHNVTQTTTMLTIIAMKTIKFMENNLICIWHKF